MYAADPPRYDEDPEGAVAYWSKLISDPTPEAIREIEKPHDGLTFEEFEAGCTESRQQLAGSGDTAALAEFDADLAVLHDSDIFDGLEDAHARVLRRIPRPARRPDQPPARLRGVRPRLIPRRRGRCERRPGSRRAVSRSAGGGSSGDPDDPEPGESARRTVRDLTGVAA